MQQTVSERNNVMHRCYKMTREIPIAVKS